MAHPSLLDDYLAHYEASKRFGAGSRQAEAWEWAWDELERLVRNEPARALRVVIALIASAPDDATIAYVAAGPLENLLCYHGNEVIDEVERSASRDERFRRALSGVWARADMLPSIQARVATAVGDIERL